MQFKERHLRILDNLMSTLRRCKISEPSGEEMLAFTESYYFLIELKKSIELSATPPAPSSIQPTPVATDETAKLAIIEPSQSGDSSPATLKKPKTKKKLEENDY